ncbi:MAG: type IV pili twitching motility protein PilT, partial [Chloroflexi bacterium CG_4_10_14_0_8_um_filter_46_9]
MHLVVNYPPFLRVNGDIKPIQEAERLSAETIERALEGLATPAQLEEFHRTLELDFGESLPHLGRIRCNAARQRGAISLAIRLLPPQIPSIDELHLPQTCKELAMYPRGLVVISG